MQSRQEACAFGGAQVSGRGASLEMISKALSLQSQGPLIISCTPVVTSMLSQGRPGEGGGGSSLLPPMVLHGGTPMRVTLLAATLVLLPLPQ